MFKCEECNSNIESMVLFRTHINRVHSLNMSFVCFQCKKKFQSKPSFFRHVMKNTCIPFILNEIVQEPMNNMDTYDENIVHSETEETQTLVNETEEASDNVRVSGELFIPKIFLNPKTSEDNKNISLENSILSCYTFLYGDYGLTRKDASKIISKFHSCVIQPILTNLESIIMPLISNFDKVSVLSEFKDINDAFKRFESYYKFLKHMKIQDLYMDPQIVEINNTIGPIISNNEPILDEIVTYQCLMPIKYQIKKFFELPGVFEETINYMYHLEKQSGTLLQSSSWQKKMRTRQNRINFPYILYSDECEIDNPLGAHAGQHSLTNLYYYFPVIPRNFSSLLKNIFVAMIYESKHKNKGNGALFHRLVDVINDLDENGIEIQIKVNFYKIFCVLHVITGDNAGLNLMLGFVRSPAANYYCRQCKCTKFECQFLCRENRQQLRNVANYTDDINSEIEIDIRASRCGIRENSIFNNINSYHVVENYAHDMMHDFWEGVCKYDISQVLTKLINDVFTLDELNNRKESFIYEDIEIGNLSVPLVVNKLREMKIEMSAREMWTFCHFLPLIIGDKVPENNEFWKLLILLIEVMDLLLLPKFDELLLQRLEDKIAEHHEKYIALFGHLRNKYHYLIHYPSMIRAIGPPKLYWCFRFESYHRTIKEYTKNTNSRMNISKSLGIKCSLNFSNRLLKKEGFSYTVDNYKEDCTDNISNRYYFNNIKNKTSIQSLLGNVLNFYSRLEYCGVIYKTSLFVTQTIQNKVSLFEIIDIIVYQNAITLVTKKYLVGEFDNHYQSFNIIGASDECFVNDIHIYDGPPIKVHTLRNQKKMIRVKYF